MRRFFDDSLTADPDLAPQFRPFAAGFGAKKASLVNENFRTEAKSCHLCNNVRG